MPDFAFLQTEPDSILVGWGPFQEATTPDPALPSFYINDFFLERPAPWHVPARWEAMTVRAFLQSAGEAPPPSISWQPIEEEAFRTLFVAAQSAINDGLFDKVVPVVFEQGVLHSAPASLPAWLLSRMVHRPNTLYLYGYVMGDRGMVGGSPEVLFRRAGDITELMALAGTRPSGRAEELRSDPKELREHQIVVDDLLEWVHASGSEITLHPTEVAHFGSLAHLRTKMLLGSSWSRMDFETLLHRLHPTAALGTSPRTPEALQWLRDSQNGRNRGEFGAPFGVKQDDGSALCVVAIRNVQWEGSSLRIGAGAGILAESTREQEWMELEGKRAQVKSLLGLG